MPSTLFAALLLVAFTAGYAVLPITNLATPATTVAVAVTIADPSAITVRIGGPGAFTVTSPLLPAGVTASTPLSVVMSGVLPAADGPATGGKNRFPIPAVMGHGPVFVGGGGGGFATVASISNGTGTAMGLVESSSSSSETPTATATARYATLIGANATAKIVLSAEESAFPAGVYVALPKGYELVKTVLVETVEKTKKKGDSKNGTETEDHGVAYEDEDEEEGGKNATDLEVVENEVVNKRDAGKHVEELKHDGEGLFGKDKAGFQLGGGVVHSDKKVASGLFGIDLD